MEATAKMSADDALKLASEVMAADDSAPIRVRTEGSWIHFEALQRSTEIS